MSQTTIIELGGRRYKVTCIPDPEPADTMLNDVEAYFSIDELLRNKLIVRQRSENKYSGRAIQNWLDKFPKPIK